MPFGEGVFVTQDWVHCGTVKDGLFADGKKVSVNKLTDELKIIVKANRLPDGTLLEKVQRFTPEFCETGLYRNGVKESEIN